jgi:hypothetical protein
MSDYIGYLLAAAPGLLAAGGLLVRVNRLERDVAQCVTREILTLHMDAIKSELARIADKMEQR